MTELALTIDISCSENNWSNTWSESFIFRFQAKVFYICWYFHDMLQTESVSDGFVTSLLEPEWFYQEEAMEYQNTHHLAKDGQ